MDIVTRFGLTVDQTTNTLFINKKDYRVIEAILSEYVVSLRVTEQVNAKEAELQARLESIVSLARLLAPQLSGGQGTFAVPEATTANLSHSKITVKEGMDSITAPPPESVTTEEPGGVSLSSARRNKLSKLRIG